MASLCAPTSSVTCASQTLAEQRWRGADGRARRYTGMDAAIQMFKLDKERTLLP